MSDMTHITISGPRANEMAGDLFKREAASGRHVLVDRPGSLMRNNLPERRLSKADVLITIQPTTAIGR